MKAYASIGVNFDGWRWTRDKRVIGLGCAVTTLGSLTAIEEDEGIERLDCALTILGTLIECETESVSRECGNGAEFDEETGLFSRECNNGANFDNEA